MKRDSAAYIAIALGLLVFFFVMSLIGIAATAWLALS